MINRFASRNSPPPTSPPAPPAKITAQPTGSSPAIVSGLMAYMRNAPSTAASASQSNPALRPVRSKPAAASTGSAPSVTGAACHEPKITPQVDKNRRRDQRDFLLRNPDGDKRHHRARQRRDRGCTRADQQRAGIAIAQLGDLVDGRTGR